MLIDLTPYLAIGALIAGAASAVLVRARLLSRREAEPQRDPDRIPHLVTTARR